jgi:hypothetical protein
MIAAGLRAHGAAVLAGDAPATLRAPEVLVPVVEAVPAPTVQLFALRAVKWRDTEGQQQIGGKFSDVFLTKSAAARALATGACVEMSNPLRRKHHGWSTERPQLDHATDLDDADPAMQAPTPIEHPSPFTIVDRGGAIQMKVARS